MRTRVLVTWLFLAILPHLSAEQHGEIWIDSSGSVAASQLAGVVKEVKSSLPQFSREHEVREWRVFHFGETTFDAFPSGFVELPVYAPPACGTPAATEAASLLKRLADERKKANERQCQQERGSSLEVWTKTAAGKFDAAFANTTPSGSCTALFDLFSRVQLYRKPTFVLVISDGEETCYKGKPSAIAAPSQGIEATMILLGKTKEVRRPFDYFQQTSAYWKRTAPWLTLIPLSELDRVFEARQTGFAERQ